MIAYRVLGRNTGSGNSCGSITIAAMRQYVRSRAKRKWLECAQTNAIDPERKSKGLLFAPAKLDFLLSHRSNKVCFNSGRYREAIIAMDNRVPFK